MGKKNSKHDVKDCLDCAVSANECTGALQHISIDPDEIAEFHRLFTGE